MKVQKSNKVGGGVVLGGTLQFPESAGWEYEKKKKNRERNEPKASIDAWIRSGKFPSNLIYWEMCEGR